jgi:outer membrane lipoprotein-sorting protein
MTIEMYNIKYKLMKNLKQIITALILAITGTAAMAQDPADIIRRMEDNMRGEASYTEMTMEVVRPRYTREISMRSWTMGDDYALISITAPARDEGTGFLKRGNDIWNYVPNIDRTIKMPPSMMSQSWMGSDFTNDDLVQGTSRIDDFSHQLRGTETVDGRECYVVEMIPHPEAPIVYEKVIAWVITDLYLPAKIENYDESDDLVSTIRFREIRTLGGRQVPTVIEMIPEDKRGHRTVMRTHDADYDINISQDFFSIENLTRKR